MIITPENPKPDYQNIFVPIAKAWREHIDVMEKNAEMKTQDEAETMLEALASLHQGTGLMLRGFYELAQKARANMGSTS